MRGADMGCARETARRVSTLHRTAAVIATTVALLNAGCGLLRVPYAITLPREPLQRIQVHSADTRAVLPEATVTVALCKHDNWMPPRGHWGLGAGGSMPSGADHGGNGAGAAANGTGPGETPVGCWYSSGDLLKTWLATRRADGVFEIEPQRKWGWVTVWAPIPSPLGWYLYDTFDLTVLVTAPGHQSVWFSNDVTLPVTPSRGLICSAQFLPEANFAESVGGVLHVYLPVAQRAARETPEASRSRGRP